MTLRKLLGIFVAGLGLAAQPAEAALAPSKTLDLVTVEAKVGASAGCPLFGTRFDRRINPDGTVSAFSIPIGYKLVITGFDWSGTGMNANSIVIAAVNLHTGTWAGLIESQASTDALGRGANSVALTTGVVADSTPALCLAIDSGLVTLVGRVHGYLTRK